MIICIYCGLFNYVTNIKNIFYPFIRTSKIKTCYGFLPSTNEKTML